MKYVRLSAAAAREVAADADVSPSDAAVLDGLDQYSRDPAITAMAREPPAWKPSTLSPGVSTWPGTANRSATVDRTRRPSAGRSADLKEIKMMVDAVPTAEAIIVSAAF